MRAVANTVFLGSEEYTFTRLAPRPRVAPTMRMMGIFVYQRSFSERVDLGVEARVTMCFGNDVGVICVLGGVNGEALIDKEDASRTTPWRAQATPEQQAR